MAKADVLAEVLAEVLGTEQVPADSNFFSDLDADSMLMARFCARVRKREDLPPVSMKDVYRHPTISALAAALPVEQPAAPTAEPAARPIVVPEREPGSTTRFVLCGAAQLLSFLAYAFVAGLALNRGYQWISAANGLFALYLRTVVFGAAAFVVVCTVPILAKWVLVGRWKPGRVPIWGLAYFRFWLVRTFVRANPLVLFTGTPLFVLYLRALGAKIGPGAAIFSRNVPVCTDLLTVGAGAVLRKDSYFNCYRAHAGELHIGAVTIGAGAVVSEATVLDIDSSLGADAHLGHASSLHAGQAVPDGERWHGSPAQPSGVDYLRVAPAVCGTWRRIRFTTGQLLGTLLVLLPVTLGGADLLLTGFPQFRTLVGTGIPGPGSAMFYRDALIVSFVGFFSALLLGLLLVRTLPRLANLVLKPDRVYPLYGFHFSVQRAVARLTNIPFLTRLFGDSSYIVPYLQYLGYDLSRVEQTGSNFGTVVRHENPYLSSVGSGTMVADGLSILNAHFSSTSFSVHRVTIGAQSFLGNQVAYPAGGRTGTNCLLATKVMVPIDGELRENTGLLGSPAFEIPRSVERDSRFDITDPAELRRKLGAKNRYNLRSMTLFLLVQWIHLAGLTMLTMAMSNLYQQSGALAITAEVLAATVFTTAYFVLLERAGAGFRALSPRFCSIYQPYFWWHERFWKMVIPDFLDRRFAGTPFKNLVIRALGVRLGRRVFDDGCAIPERTLATIGDDCTLNVHSVMQCHSQEDGTFKSDRTTLGAGCTLGVGSFVHYGVTLGDGATLAPDTFLMKGEEVPAHATWAGNPARDTR